MEQKQVVLIRKQGMPFTVNYPKDGRTITYTWLGTKGNAINERPVPYEVFEWLKNETSTFEQGCLIIKETEDEEVALAKENIEDIEKVEESVLSKKEVEEMLTTGNHNALKGKLNSLTEDMEEDLAKKTKQYILGLACEIGVDSSAKRKVLCDWADIEYENSDLFFDKYLKEMYKK